MKFQRDQANKLLAHVKIEIVQVIIQMNYGGEQQRVAVAMHLHIILKL